MAATASPTPITLYVANTGGDGVYIRRTPSLADRLRAWPEGAAMLRVGNEQEGEGIIWRNVRDPDGNVGWVPQEYLSTSMPPSPTPQPVVSNRAAPSVAGGGLGLTIDSISSESVRQHRTPLGLQAVTLIGMRVTLTNKTSAPLPTVGTAFYPGPMARLVCPQGIYLSDAQQFRSRSGAISPGESSAGRLRFAPHGEVSARGCTLVIEMELSSVQGHIGPKYISATARVP